MKKDPRIFLDHIIDSIKDIKEYTKSMVKEKFLCDKKTQDAVIRRIEIIGEAVKNLPTFFKKKYPIIRWKEPAGMRDFLVHEYFGVNVKIVWKTVQEDIPKLKLALVKLLGQIEKESLQLRIK